MFNLMRILAIALLMAMIFTGCGDSSPDMTIKVWY